MSCSCPGKVLLVGGYLVLDRRYSGLVLSLDARIHCRVTKTGDGSGEGDAPKKDWRVVVRSPQFSDAEWVVTAADAADDSKGSDDKENDNPFVREAVRTTLAAVGGYDCEVEVRADDQYYSDIRPTLRETKKTGLGSSAALTTSLVGALYAARRQHVALDEVHALAQRAHATAQGKIGSGFDVAAAVYGSCVYRRFESLDAVDSASCLPVRVPFKLLMGDRTQGSSTPGMVKKVLASKEALALYPEIDTVNEQIVGQLTSEDATKRTEACAKVRPLMKRLGQLAGVEVEPDVQTEILDATEKCQGIVLTGVPGAGGYDAIFALLVTGDDDAEQQVRGLWEKNGLKVMDVHQDGRGILFQ